MKHLGLGALLGLLMSCRLDWDLPPRDDADAGAAVDAGSLAEAGVGDAATGCAGALVCSNFDDGKLIPPWGQTFLTTSDGVLRVQTDPAAPSSPNVLFVSRPAATKPPAAAFVQSTTFTQSLTHFVLAFQVRAEQTDPAAHACIAGINLDDSLANEHTIRIMMGAATASVQDRSPDATIGTYALSAVTPRQRWSAVTLTVDIPGRIVVQIDGATALDAALDPRWTASTATRSFVGINFVETPAQAFAFSFDDVSFDAR